MASTSSAPPHFTRPISTRTACAAGGAVVLEALAVGRPLPAITWLRNGVTIERRGSKHQAQHEADSGKCRLVINDVGDEDEGEYECRAKNRLGQVSCFGELYVESEVLESKSGLFILIDEGSQDDDNSADDEMGCKESISASEQIESIIEDLTMGDGSLSLSMGSAKEAGEHFVSEADDREDLPLDDGYRHFKSKPLRSIDEDLRDQDIFEDADDAEEEDFKCGQAQRSFGRQNLALHLHKVSGVEENLHRAFEDEDGVDPTQGFEQVQTAEAGGQWGFQSYRSSGGGDSVVSRPRGKTKGKQKAVGPSKVKTTRGAAPRPVAPESGLLTSEGSEDPEDEQFDGAARKTGSPGVGNNRKSVDEDEAFRDSGTLGGAEESCSSYGKKRTKDSGAKRGEPGSEARTLRGDEGDLCSEAKAEGPSHRDSEVRAEGRSKARGTPATADDDHSSWVASSRRNTTDCVEQLREKERPKMVRQRSHSDGRSAAAGEFGPGDEDRGSPQQCPWESLEKIWRDSLPTESGDDPMPSDVEVSNDEVFLEHSGRDEAEDRKDRKAESQHPRNHGRPRAKMSYSRSTRSVSSRSYQAESYSYSSTDGFAQQSVGFSRVTSSIGGDSLTNVAQTRSVNVAYAQANYDTDDSRSEPERCLTTKTSVVSRSRRLQFHPSEATDGELPPASTSDIVMRRQGSVPVRLLASEDDESEKENLAEESRRRRERPKKGGERSSWTGKRVSEADEEDQRVTGAPERAAVDGESPRSEVVEGSGRRRALVKGLERSSNEEDRRLTGASVDSESASVEEIGRRSSREKRVLERSSVDDSGSSVQKVVGESDREVLERSSVDSGSSMSGVAEEGDRRTLAKVLKRSSVEESDRVSVQERVLERSSVDSGSSVQKAVEESDREVLERPSVDSGSSMSGVAEEGDRRTLAKVLKRSSVEESDRVSLQERVLERSSVDSGSSVQKAVEESDRKVLERSSVDSGSSMSGVVEEGDRRTLTKVLKRSSVDNESSVDESGHRSSREKRVLERSSVDDSGSSAQKVVGESDREVLERPSVDSGSSMSGVVEEGDRRTLTKVLKRSSVEESDRASLQERVLERSSVDSRSSVQKAVEESDRKVLERPSVDSRSSMSGVVEEGDSRSLAKVLKRSSVDNESSVDESGHRSSREKRVLERSSVDSRSSVQKAVEESDREVLERSSVDSGSSMSGVVEEGDRRSLAKVLKRSSVDNESSVEESDRRSSSQAGVLQRSAIDNESLVREALQGRSSTRAPERSSRDNDSPKTESVRKGHFSTDAPERTSIGEPPMSEARGTSVRSPASGQAVGGESDRRSSAASEDDQRRSSAEVVKGESVRRSSARALETSSRDEDGFGAASRILRDRSNLNDPETRSGGRADRSPAVEKRGLPVTPSLRRAVRQLSDSVSELTSAMQAVGHTPALQSRDDIIEQYVVTTDYTPLEGSEVGSIALREGQIVEVVDSDSKYKWLVRTRPSKYLSPRQGWIPSSYLEKKTAETTLRTLHNIMDAESDIRSDSKEREAATKRRAIVKELVDTEDEFVNDMQHVVHTYLKEMDNPRMPKELRDQRESLFLNFQEICDFHNNVLIKGVQYYAGEPSKLGKTFLRLERDFDMHAKYCQEEPKAQDLFSTAPVKEYFQEYSKRIGEIDKNLSDHLKLPIQRINDYQLLLKELIKYTSRLGEDCADLQKALDLMLSIPQRAHDLKYINSIEGFRGNIQKLGRLLRHQDWFTVTDAEGRSKERYLFLFRSRIFVTKVRKVTESRPVFILKDIVKLDEVEVKDTGAENAFEFHHKVKGQAKYPLKLVAQTEAVKEAWLKELGSVVRETAELSDLGEDAETEVAEEGSNRDASESEEKLKITEITDEDVEEREEKVIAEARRTVKFEEDEEKPRVEVLENFEAYEELNTVMTESVQSGSVNSVDANEYEDGGKQPRFRKPLKATTCIPAFLRSLVPELPDGDTATLECELQAVPPATVTWLKDNVPLAQSEKVQSVSKGNSSYLVVKNAEQEDSGLYLCKASNAHGTASCSAQLNVQEPLGEATAPSPSPKAPQFAIKFKDTELLEGTSVRFLIKIHPEGTVKFLKNDRPLKEDDRVKFITEDQSTYELAIGHVTKKDDGKYTCVASNSVGENSFSALVKVSSEKDLFPGIQDVPVLADGSLKKGEQPDFKWFKGGQEIETCERFKVLFKDEEDSLALVFQHVTPEDAGLYTCVASTSSGRISCSAELSVEGAVKQLLRDPEAPQITCNLTDTEVSEGASAMLDLKVTGYPKPKLSWLKDGTEVKSGGRFKFLHEDDESMALIIKSVAYGDAGVYTVKAKNDLGEVSTSGHLLVKAPPKFKKQLKDVSVMTNEPAKFEVEVEGQPAPEVTWYKDGQVVKESDRVKISAKKDAALLEIKKVVPEDAGSYSCVATNTSGKISEFATLTVNDPPKFLKELKSLECKEAETIKFEAKVSGSPEPNIKWLFNGEEIKADGSHVKIEKDDRNHSLTVSKATRKDAGKYTLSISSDIGSASSSGDLTVNSLPAYVKGLSNVDVKEGESDFRLEVKVSGYPEPKIRWFIESMEIDEKSKKYKIAHEGETRALIIKQVDTECAGTYSCTISNAHGEASTKGTVNVLTKPNFAEKLKDAEFTEQSDVSYSVKVTGNPTPNLKWYKDNQEVNVSATVKVSKLDEGGCCSLTLTKVTEEFAGQYECRASNTEGDAVTISRLVVNKVKHVKSCEDEDAVKKEGSENEEKVVENAREETATRKKRDRSCRKESYSVSSVQKSSRSYVCDGGGKRMSAEVRSETTEEESGITSKTIKESRFERLDDAGETLKITEVSSDVEESSLDRSTSKPTIGDSDQDESWKMEMKGKRGVEGAEESFVLKLDEEGERREAEDESVEGTVRKVKVVKKPEEQASGKDKGGEKDEVLAKNRRNKEDSAHPRFECDLKDVVVWNGMDAVIEAVGTAIPAPEVKWYKDGELLVDIDRVLFEEDGKFHRVHIANTVTEDSGVFKIELKNKLGEMSQEGRLTVKASNEAEEPVLMKKLQDVVCVKGNHAHFEAKIFANPEPEIHWYKDGKELTASDRVIVSSNNIKQTHSLTVKNVSEEDAGTYSVGAKNANGEISSQASLDVQVPPVIQEIKDKKAMPGSSVSFETKVVGKPKPSFKWLKGTVQLVEGDKVKLESDEVNGVYKLHLKGLTPEDSGEYACSAENVAGTVRLPFNLNVTTEAPHFIKGLHDAKCKLNNPVKLEVQVYGLPMPGVKWFKGDSEIEEGWKFKTEQTDERNFSLTIDKFCGEDAVKYVCKAFNQAGEAVTHCELALKHALPEFLKHLPKEVCIIDGEPFVLEAKLDNNPMPEIKWMKDGKEIAPDDHVKIEQLPDGTVKLSVEDGIPEDRGKYTLVATNEDGQDSSSGQVVVEAIPKAPKFLKKLEDTTVPQGKKLKLVAKVTAHPRPSVKWLKNGKPVKLDARTRLLEEPGGLYALEIDDVRPEDEAKYTLQVANHRGEASSDADVIVTGPVTAPEFLQGLKPVSATDGAPCRLEAKVGGKPLPTCKWFKDGEPFSPDGERVKAIARPDGTVALLFEKTEPKDAGKYSLEATNPHGSATSEGGLSVAGKEQAGERNKAPAFVVPLRDITVDEGKPIRLQAQIEGNPYPDVSWTKDGEPLKMNDSLFFVCEGNKIGLEVRKAAPGDAGRYECTLTNPEGKASSKADAAVTKLFTAPGFTQKTSDMFALPGSDPRFVCKVHGFPKPDVTWFFNDRPIEHDSNKYKLRRDGDMCVLQVKGATPEDRGTYRCKATNDAGEAECAAKLDVTDMGEKKDRAEPPSFLKKLGDCSLMEGMTAKFTACVAGFPEPTFKWYKNGSELTDSDKSKFQVEPHGLLRLVIKGATACDVGDYALKISNPHGEAESKARLVFDTYEDKKPRERKPDLDLDLNRNKRPVDDDDSGRGRNKNLDGDLNKLKRPGDDDADGRPRVNGDYDGRPDIKMSDRNGDLDTLKKPKEDGLDKKPKDKMLDLNVDYEKFRRSAIPLALPDKPIISKMSDRRLTLSWKPCIPIGPSVPVTYIVDMCEVPNGEWFPARSGIRGCCCEIRNLEPFRDYKFRVRVENKYGISDPSPYAVTYRQKLEMTPPKQLPRLPPELDFRMDTSPYFPKDYDIDRPPHEEYAHAPRFLRQTDDTQYGIKGEPASVEWYVYGYPTPVVSFLFKDQVVPMGGHYESIIARNGQCKLYLSRMMDKDVGIYECIAVNEHGEARQRINLAIAEHPVFTMHLDEESIMLRKSGVLQCRVVGVPYPNVKWYKDWHPIVSSNRIKIEWKEPDLCTLTISDAINKDGGMYSCGARNIAGMATTSAMVTIEENEDDYALLKYSHSRVVRAHPRPMEDAYDIGDELGRGTQGITYHAVERATGNSYAAKCMYGKGPDTRAMMRHELDIMNQLHDRHLIRARDGFENKNSLTIVTDLAGGGELFDNICKQSALTESDIAHYIRQVLWGLDHMHDKGIAHLGLTPGDILLSKPGGDDIKICDFGLANRIVKGKDFYMDYGMPEFVAPEIVHHRPVSFPADMWSVGVITYLLLSGISPFLGDTDRETLRRIQKGQLTFDPEIFTMVSDEAKDFISKLLVFDSQGRLDVKAALKHPWLRFADNLGSGNMIDTDRLRNYYRRYKDWVRNSACDRYYRRRPLKSAYEDPSGMIYPPGERYTPPSSPESTPTPRTKHDFEAPKFADNVDREHEDLNYDLGYADSTSRYQNGPDTYLLQLRDVGFPLRLREYMRVSAERSPTLGMKFQDTFSGQAVTVRERRRFTDVMDEEIDDEKQGQLDGVKRRIRSEINPRSETKNRIKELLPNSHKEELAPYFREKLQDVAFSDEQEVELSCLAIGEPKPVITWYRNDVLMSESHRVKFSEDAKGRSFIRFNPAKAFDAGLYKAVARNVAGETACRARLRKGEIPGKVDAPLVAQTSDTEALVTWHYPKMDGHSQITGYGLEFKELDEPSWHEVASNITHQFMVAKNLQPGRRYVFRVRASNGFGCGDYSGPSQTAETLESGAQKVTISRAMKYQQELTELGKAVDASVRRRSLDYAVEENPVPISNGVPTEKYNFVSEISRGRFSLVVKCCQRDGDEVFAAKLLEVTPSTEASIKNEYEVFKRLRHERIPCLREAFSYNSIFVLVEEKLQGFDVLTYLTRNPSYSEDVVTRIVTQVLDALEYLHFRSIVHLDVQPDNVVVSNLSNAQVKLVDFGSAKLLSKFEIQKGDKRGNHEFMAPEVFNQEDLTVQADIWSTGVLAYVLLSGVSPFRGVTTQETAQNITFVRYRFEHLYKEITPEATRFLMAIFKKTPQKRPTADECLEQKWLNPSELLLKKRERAIFGSSKLRQYADEYHKQRQNVATTSEKLLGAFGMQFSRSVSVEYDTMTTF